MAARGKGGRKYEEVIEVKVEHGPTAGGKHFLRLEVVGTEEQIEFMDRKITEMLSPDLVRQFECSGKDAELMEMPPAGGGKLN